VTPALALLAISSARAQSPGPHPDLSGFWLMDPAKSPGPMIPLAMTYAIEQRGDTLRMKRDTKSKRGEFSATLVYGTDGKPWKNSVTEGGVPVDVSSVLRWEGSMLIINSTLVASGQEIRQVEKLSLDASGGELVSARSVEAAGQQFLTKLVFTRRP
jgi:hypothetical protein